MSSPKPSALSSTEASETVVDTPVRGPWPLTHFSWPDLDFETLDPEQLIEEEGLPDYKAERYYPVHIGELLDLRYQVVGKLGFGTSSTVWLARDLPGRRHVTLKIFIRSSSWGDAASQELPAYQRLANGPLDHPGRHAIRPLLGSFTIIGPHGEHQCLVHTPLWDSLKTFLARNPIGRMPIPLLALTLQQVFKALDYAKECKVIHTDIKADNIMFGIGDPTVMEDFERAELEHPSARKEIAGRTIYTSRRMEIVSPGSLGPPVLCDFGSAEWGEEKHVTDVQPDSYRSPEVILEIPWSYEIDIWNIGCVVWDLFEGRHLFRGIDPEHREYKSRAHLAEMITILGPPLPGLVFQGAEWPRFFSDKGEYNAGLKITQQVPLARLETNLAGEDKELFLKLMDKMLQWDPKKRYTPKQLLQDEWVKAHTYGG